MGTHSGLCWKAWEWRVGQVGTSLQLEVPCGLLVDQAQESLDWARWAQMSAGIILGPRAQMRWAVLPFLSRGSLPLPSPGS